MTTVAQANSNINVSTFIEVLKRSKLVDPAKLQHALKSVALTSDKDRSAADVAEQLIVAGLITKWQAAQLLKAKYRGFLLGKYVIRKPLGRGGMGIVYEAEHSVLNTRVAIKILPKARSNVEKSVSRFLAEARAAAKLVHPNIVRVHDCDVIDDRRFMVMDLVEGANLGEVVEQHGKLGYRNALLLLRQAAAGLGYAHDQGITHRDVKPHNFLIDNSGQLKVSDMGLALFEIDSPERHTQDGSSSILGTVDYVAPEQAWDSRKVDRRADMYSLGCTLYFMLSGRSPFNKGTMAQRLAMHQTAQPTPLPELLPDCPLPIWRLCEKMLAKKPQDRLQKMSEVALFCDQILPRLAPSGPDIAALVSAGKRNSPGEDSSGGWNGGGVQGSQEYQPEGSLDSPSFLNSGSMADFEASGAFDTALGSFGQQAGGSTEASYWNTASTVATKSKPMTKRELKAFRDSIYAKFALGGGLALALAGLGLSIWMAVTYDPKSDAVKPPIRTSELQDGTQVIIVESPD